MILSRHSKTGFTLVELMLAMSIIGVLLIAIASTSIFIMGIYTKGVTTREINQAGRAISEDMQRTIAMAAPFKVDPAKTGASTDDTSSMYVAMAGQGGRLCTGSYTYAWNYGRTKQIAGGDDYGSSVDITGGLPDVYNEYRAEDVASGDDPIRFVKVLDPGGGLCADTGRDITKQDARELLTSGDRSLAVQGLEVVERARHDASGQAMYSVNLVLGTNRYSQLESSGNKCKPPSEDRVNFNFCSINQFDIIVRAGSRSGSM